MVNDSGRFTSFPAEIPQNREEWLRKNPPAPDGRADTWHPPSREVQFPRFSAFSGLPAVAGSVRVSVSRFPAVAIVKWLVWVSACIGIRSGCMRGRHGFGLLIARGVPAEPVIEAVEGFGAVLV